MDKRKREIIALVLLMALLLGGAGFFGFYLTNGHKWNLAATTIDDTVGNMDGYVVVLYEGTDTPQAAPVKPMADARVSSTVLLADTKKSYGDKGANVFSLRTNGFRYAESFVLLHNGYRIGFMPVDKDTPYLSIDRQIALFAQRHVDVVVALEYSENEYLESVDGVDVILQLGESPKDEPIESDEQGDSLSENQETAEGESADDEPRGAATEDGQNADNVESLTVAEQAEIEKKADAARAETEAKSALDAEKAASAESASSSASSASSSASSSSSHKLKKSNAYVVDRRDRGTIAAVLISPNNIISTKTISE